MKIESEIQESSKDAEEPLGVLSDLRTYEEVQVEEAIPKPLSQSS